MELCVTTRCISTANLPKLRPFAACRTHIPWKSALPLSPNSITRKNQEPVYYNNSSIKLKASEEASSEANKYVKDESDVVATVDEVQDGGNSGFRGFGSGDSDDFVRFRLGSDDTPTDGQFPLADFWDKLIAELDFEDSFSIALLGGGGLVALWLATAIVGAIDNIPLFPKLMEVVGLGYTVWFSTRYLLFKKNRDELTAKIEEVKQQVLGPKN